MRRIPILTRSAMLAVVCIMVCYPSSAQNQITGRVVDTANKGLANIPIYVRDEAGELLGDNRTKNDGSYTCPFRSIRGKIKATYGNAVYPVKAVPNLSGQTNHELTIVLAKAFVPPAADSSFQRDDDEDLRLTTIELGLNLDEARFPAKQREQILELKAAATKLVKQRSSRMDLSGTIVSQEAIGSFSMQTTAGVRLKVKLIDGALCGNTLDRTLRPCVADAFWKTNLVGRRLEINAFVSSAYGIALADRVTLEMKSDF